MIIQILLAMIQQVEFLQSKDLQARCTQLILELLQENHLVHAPTGYSASGEYHASIFLAIFKLFDKMGMG